jgi:hypothetical protein
LNHGGPTARNRVRSKVTQAIMAREIISIAGRKLRFLGKKYNWYHQQNRDSSPRKYRRGF